MECLELVMDLQSKIFDLKKLILPHPLTNFEIQKYYENEPRFNGSSSRDNLSKKIKDGTYVTILMSILIFELIGLLCVQ